YDLMAHGFTLETYVYVSEKPTSGYVDLVSNQQGGGFGFELKASGGKVHFYCHDGSGYKQPAQDIPEGEWVHLVGVFDGSNVIIYLNGKAVSVTAGSTLKPPSADAQYLCIGGDSDEGTGASFMTGKIATVNLYSFALTEAMVTSLYSEY
ncbi:MAG: LamG domain-containing protein, partial [Clostridia bacterium]|nr:LamG domain-containing protein [Clostridia bacterium]